MSAIEYLMRVRPDGEGFTASIRQFSPTSHPEVRCVIGPVSHGEGANASAAMVAAIAAAHIECVPSTSAVRFPDA